MPTGQLDEGHMKEHDVATTRPSVTPEGGGSEPPAGIPGS